MIAIILQALGITGGWCVEIGAWDGEFLSNTISLVRKGFYCLMVEGDEGRSKALFRNAAKAEYGGRITPVNAMVGPGNVGELMKMVDGYMAVISIDIDGGEEDILAALPVKFAVVVMEWNDKGNKHHWSVLEAADRCGYIPVHATNSNVIFVLAGFYRTFCEGMAKIEESLG